MASKVLFVVDSDSNVKFATAFSSVLSARGVACDTVFVGSQLATIRQSSNAILNDAVVEVVPSFDQLCSGKRLIRYDVIFLLVTGKLIVGLCNYIKLLALKYGVPKPTTVGGFIGEWISSDQQVSERAALDVFVVNRADEVQKFREICGRDAYGKRFITFPYVYVIRHAFCRPLAPTFEYDLTKTIVFADQVQVPRTADERAYLYHNLLRLARQAPERKIYFCSREIEGGATAHTALDGIAQHLGAQLAATPNLVVEFGTFRQRLAEADVVVSVSSTAGIEALVNGIPALFLKGFTSSGAEKFAETGLLIDVFELAYPREYELAPAFYEEISRTGVWDEFAAMLQSQPAAGTNVRAARRVAVTSLLKDSSLSGRYADVVYGAIDNNDTLVEVEIDVPYQPLDLATLARQVFDGNMPLGKRTTLSDVIHVPSLSAPPSMLPVTYEGSTAVIPLNVAARELTLHLPVALGPEDQVRIEGVIRGEPVRIEVGKTVAVNFHDPHVLRVAKGTYGEKGAEVSALRLRSFEEVEFQSARVLPRGNRAVPLDWAAWEPKFNHSRIGVLAPTIASPTVPLAGRPGIQILRLEREWFGHEGPLVTWQDAAGHTLELAAVYGSQLALTLRDGQEQVKKLRSNELDLTVVVINTQRVTLVMVNENLCVFEAQFVPARMEIATSVPGGLKIAVRESFVADVKLAEANRLIELLLLEFYSGKKYARKHREIPEFRSAVESQLAPDVPAPARGKPVAPIKTQAAEGKSKGGGGGAAAGPLVGTVKRTLAPFMDLIPEDDLSEVALIAQRTSGMLKYSQGFVAEGAYAKALAISLIAVSRTPSSSHHMLICAESLIKLRDARAEGFIRRAEALRAGDAAFQARCESLRAQMVAA